MTLKVLNPFPYTLLPSGILIVEPHEGLLTARSMLLAAADYYVNVSACSENQLERSEECEVAIAILSESLGRAVLSGTAEIVRRNWPRARILIFGKSGDAIEDHLYDARMDHRARPEDLWLPCLCSQNIRGTSVQRHLPSWQMEGSADY